MKEITNELVKKSVEENNLSDLLLVSIIFAHGP
jgi:hypothetical protein